MGFGSVKKLKYISRYMDVRGKVRWRFRKSGLPQSQTTELFGTKAWWDWYASALEPQTQRPLESVEERLQPGTIHSLMVAYYSSADFQGLKLATRRTYKGILDRYRDKYGHLPAGQLQAHHIRAQMDKQAATPAAANNMLKVLRAVMRFGGERNLVKVDPTSGVRMLRYKGEGFPTWSEAEIAAFRAHWPMGTNERLAFELLLYTGQRSGDVRQMKWSDLRGDVISVRQEKTGVALLLPVHPRLREVLDLASADHQTIIATQHGDPYSPAGFGNWFRGAAKTAGIEERSAHGLRKSAATRLADAGCSESEIKSVTGHKTGKEVDRYTKARDQRTLAEAAMAKIKG